MTGPVLTAEEMIAWNDTTAQRFLALVEKHPEAMALPCDIRECHTVAEVLQHVAAAELRYAERLANCPVTDYATLSNLSRRGDLCRS